MVVFRVIVGVLALLGIAFVIGSVLRTVVVPRAIPARLGRVAFLIVRRLLLLRLRLGGRSDYATRDRVFALQAPLGLFAQLFTWGGLLLVLFAAVFWSLTASAVTGVSIARALEVSGSSMLTLGFIRPSGLIRELTGFAAAAGGLTLLALVVTYLPTIYGAFSRREALITKLVVRTGIPPSGPSLLASSWKLGRFDQLEEVWNGWEEWFVDLGETHTSFPQLPFFRSPHPRNHWVLAAESVLDGAALLESACDVPRQSRSELCLRSGLHALISIADFLGIPHRPPEPGAEISLTQAKFDEGRATLDELGVPLRADADAAWLDFRTRRARYEPLIAVLGAMTDAPRSDWSSWSESTPRHSPPLIRMRVRRD